MKSNSSRSDLLSVDLYLFFFEIECKMLMKSDMFICSFLSTTKITNKHKKTSPAETVLFIFLPDLKAWLFDAQFIIYFMGGSKTK